MQGYLAPGFEAVGEAFNANFRDGRELGAAFAAFRNGEPLVDVWSGTADRNAGRKWNEDSLQLVFSGTKGLVATCMLILLERKQLSLDEPVQRYWPEFGKRHILVRDVVAHTARLPGFDVPITLEDLKDDRQMGLLLARQSPSQDTRAKFCYHGLTYGWLCGELVRRVDGRSIGKFFSEEIASVLGLELWLGLPAVEEPRVTTLELSPRWGARRHLDPKALESDGLLRSVWGNPEFLSPGSFPWNRSDFHSAEIPAVNAIGTARAIARLYSCLAAGGHPILKEDTVRVARQERSHGFDALLGDWLRFGVGFQLQTETLTYGPARDAFGHSGAGGSVHAAWPTERVGFSYAMNLMVDGAEPDNRASTLLNALHGALNRQSLS